MKSNCVHLINGACTHTKSNNPVCVMDDPRAHQCRLVYNDRRRKPREDWAERDYPVPRKATVVVVPTVPASPFDALLKGTT